MFVSPAFTVPVLYERKDRRNRQRFAYPAVVHVNGRPVPGRDISPKGVSVFVAAPAVGDVVTVSLTGSGPTDDGQETTSRARVVRVDRSDDGYVVGLEFIE
jgi:hypothetical protein